MFAASLASTQLPAFSQQADFYYPINATPASYAIAGLAYSAQFMRTEIKILPDGSKSTNLTYYDQARDGEGRVVTRVQCSGCALSKEKTRPYQVLIDDPAMQRVIHLYSEEQLAIVFGTPVAAGQAGQPPSLQRMSMQTELSKPAVLQGKMIGGMYATGLRWTRTMPAGQSGSDRQVEIVTERWYSPELKIMLLDKISDPRFGETIEEVTSVIRANPDPALFQIPTSYRIQNMPPIAPKQPIRH